MAEVFSAEVTVSIAKYAAEIAKIEAETGKSATKAATALVAPLVAAQVKAGTAAQRAAAEAADAWGGAAALQAAALNASIDAANRDAAAWDQARMEETEALNKLIDAEQRANATRASATARLIDITAQHGTATDRLTLAFTKQKAEIQALAAASGNAAAAEKAMIAVENQHAAQLAALQNDTKGVGVAAAGAKVSYANLGNQIADVGKGLASGVSPLTIATQQGEQLYFALMQAGGATAVLKAGLAAMAPFAPHIAAIAIAAAALGAAWHMATKELDAATAAMDANASAATAAQKAHEELAKVRDSTTDKWLVATKQATEKDLELRDAVKDITAAYAGEIKAEQDAIAALKAEAAASEAVVKSKKKWTEETYAARVAQNAANAAVAEHEKRLYALNVAQGDLIQKASIGILTVEKDTEGRKKNAKAIKEQTVAFDDSTAQANAKAYGDALAAIDAMSFGLKKNKGEVELLSDAYHANLEAIKASEAEALSVVSGNADAEYTARHAALLKSVEAYDAFYRDVEALREASEAKAEEAARDGLKLQKAMQEKQTKIFEQGEKDRLDMQAAYQAAGASIAGSVGDAFALIQENMTGLSKKEAMALFRVTQAAQIAQSLLLLPAAILQGLAQAGPAGGIAAGLAGGVAVAQIAAAKPPSFRRGGTAYPDERQVRATVEDGEVMQVTSRQGVAKANSDAHNAGVTPGGASGGARLVLNGRDLGRIVEGGLQSARGRAAVAAAPARGRAPRRTR